MNEVLREATLLLNDYKPKEALQKLSELNSESEQSLLLKERCKSLLRQQILYLLRELDLSKDNIKIRKLTSDYVNFIGYDDNIAPYINHVKKNESQEEGKKKMTANVVVFSLLGIALIIVLLFI